MAIRHGRNTQLLLQREATFRTAPSTPAAFLMKWTELEFGRDPQRAEDPTIQNTPLAVKKDCGDAVFGGSLKSILCLNDIGQWLTLLWGTPVTTGAGPYVHTWTLGMAARPSALLELGYINASKYPRWLGAMLNTLSWDIKEADQSISMEFLAGEEVTPEPTAAFDAAPTSYAKNRACSKGGEVYDVQGASTLGRVSKASIKIGNDFEGQNVADGKEGFGEILLGQPTIDGSVTVLFDDGTNIFDYGRDHTSKPMTLISRNDDDSASLKLVLPAVEFDEAKHKISTSKGLLVDTNWRAHADTTAPTLVLTNGISGY